MYTNTVILAGTIVIEGVAFRWSVTDGFAQNLTVCHPTLGSRVERLVGSPDAQARAAGHQLLAGNVSVPEVDTVHDVTLASPIDFAAERKLRRL
jgi:hypothetical protein